MINKSFVKTRLKKARRIYSKNFHRCCSLARYQLSLSFYHSFLIYLSVFCGVINRGDVDNDDTMSGKSDSVLDEIIERNKDVTTDDLRKTGKTGLN